MKALQVTGGTPLYGSVRLGGAKNASFKLMIAALLSDEESRLLNFSRISDVEMVGSIIEGLGGRARRAGERAMIITGKGISQSTLDATVGGQGRYSTLFIPVLLNRFKDVCVPLPGGDAIGKRPLERHFEGLSTLGVHLEERDGLVYAHADQLVGSTYRFKKNSHTGTETLILAAVKAKGTTILENAAEEPEIDDLIDFLNSMGGNIRRRPGKVIEIQGVSKLHGAIHKLMSDRNEAVSYACAALVTRGDIIIENAHPTHLESFLDAVRAVGGEYEVGSYGIRFFVTPDAKLKAADITTSIHPGFMTDWQPLFTTVLTQCEGESIVHETVMQQRFQHVAALQQMGASIELFNPEVSNPEKVYNFNLEDDSPTHFHAIRISGAAPLRAASFTVHDLRHGATLIAAAMAAQGASIISGVHHIDRGYEDLPERLVSMGAQIESVEVPDTQ